MVTACVTTKISPDASNKSVKNARVRSAIIMCLIGSKDIKKAVHDGDLPAPGTDVVLYYRAGVRDRTNEGPGTQDSMICKKVGPVFVPVGWNGADALFSNGFE